MYKNVIENDVELEGYCFVEHGGCGEVIATIPWSNGEDLVVDILTDYNGETIAIYHKDIPKLIKVLEAAYNHKD